MKTKQMRIDEGIARLETLKQEVILRYAQEIDFDQELSLYDVMMKRFAAGELDDVFLTDAIVGMSKKEVNDLFALAHEFQGLCFSRDDVDSWLDSIENTSYYQYDVIAHSIFDSFSYLLELAKVGGRDVLELLVAVRASEDLRDEAIIPYLRTSFVDDRALTAVLLDMSSENSFYDIFTEEQKGILLTYPEGTLYSYGKKEIRITSPLLLGVQIYNSVNGVDYMDEIDEKDIKEVVDTLSDFYRDEYFDFTDEVMILNEKYRDYSRKTGNTVVDEYAKVTFDFECEALQNAWLDGDEVLGGTLDTPYAVVIK